VPPRPSPTIGSTDGICGSDIVTPCRTPKIWVEAAHRMELRVISAHVEIIVAERAVEPRIPFGTQLVDRVLAARRSGPDT
jgi:hypothetical protein